MKRFLKDLETWQLTIFCSAAIVAVMGTVILFPGLVFFGIIATMIGAAGYFFACCIKEDLL